MILLLFIAGLIFPPAMGETDHGISGLYPAGFSYWSGQPLALVIEMDDSYLSQNEFIAVLDSFDLRCTLVTNEESVESSGSYMTYADLRGHYNNGHEIAWHGRWHGTPPGYLTDGSFGMIRYSTCDSIGIEYDWSEFYTLLELPNWTPRTFCPPNHRYNREVIDLIIADNILGNRVVPKSTWDSNVADWDDIATYGCAPAPKDSPEIAPTALTWSGDVNPYAIGFTSLNSIIGSGERTKASVYIAVNSYFDAQLPDSSCTVLYFHRKTADGGELTVEEFSWMIHAVMDYEEIDINTMWKHMYTYRSAHKVVPGTDRLVWNPTGISSIESWVFSNSSTLPIGSYDNTINTVGGSGEVDTSSPTSTRSVSSSIRVKLAGGGWPLDTTPERGVLIDFDVATELSGLEIVKATLGMEIALGDASGAEATLDVIGIIDSDYDDWVGFSTSTVSDVSLNYYDTSETTAWVTALSTYSSTTPDDGWTNVYPATGTFWGVHYDTVFTSHAGGQLMTFNVTEAVQAWAAGENEGGFLLFGIRSGGLSIVLRNIGESAEYRPYLEVYTR